MSRIYKHAIIIIKNNNNQFLQYYDTRWNSYLFLNCKVNDENSINKIKDEIKNKLNINEDKISIDFIFDKIHRKFSESNKKEKEYHHYFFNINTSNIINQEKKFKINGIDFKWYSINELEQDERIKEVNSDIVSYIREYICKK